MHGDLNVSRSGGMTGLAVGILMVHLSGCGTAPCDPSTETPYYLPYQAERTCFVGQSNFGPWSHQDEYAVDFSMPMHTPIVAARAGVVVAAVDTNTETCWLTQDCAGNHVIIKHEDGTRARYWHLEYGGTVVAVGQNVQRGQVIGYSGQTGIAFIPHLHFSVRDANGKSMEVRFADICDNNGVPLAMHQYRSQNTTQPSP